jgi:hypothetical protein
MIPLLPVIGGAVVLGVGTAILLRKPKIPPAILQAALAPAPRSVSPVTASIPQAQQIIAQQDVQSDRNDDQSGDQNGSGGSSGFIPQGTFDPVQARPDQDIFVDPNTGLRLPNSPPPTEQVSSATAQNVAAQLTDRLTNPLEAELETADALTDLFR